MAMFNGKIHYFNGHFIVIQWDINGIYPLVNIQIAMEHGPVEMVDLPIKNGGSFHCKMLVHQRVNPKVSIRVYDMQKKGDDCYGDHVYYCIMILSYHGVSEITFLHV